MLKKLIKFSGVLAFLGIIFVAPISQAFAQSVPPPPNLTTIKPPTDGTTGQSTLVATVNIYSAKIISQDKNTFKISFDISNRIGVQPDVRYSVQLVKTDPKLGDTIADEYVYPEILNLGENVTIHKEISYTAPSSLNGKYQLWLISRSGSGLMFALSSVKEVTLVANPSGSIGISPETCFLSVKGDAKNTEYTLRQGVDIAQNESLLVTCQVKNSFANTIEVKPKFETFYRTVFGDKVNQIGGSTSIITFKAGETKTVSVELPKAEKPQAYDIRFSLVNSTGATSSIVSNTIIVHYVLSGGSATIQNLTLDKDYYAKGEIAKLTAYWTPSADSFMGSRIGVGTGLTELNFDITITDKDNNPCGQILNKQPQGIVEKDIPIPITADCVSPKVNFSLSGKSATDGSAVNVTNDFEINTAAKNIPVAKEKNLLGFIIFAVSGLVLVLGGIVYLIKNKKVNPIITNIILLGIIGISAYAISPSTVKAESWAVFHRDIYGTSGTVTWTDNIDNTIYDYDINNIVTVTGTGEEAACSNYVGVMKMQAAMVTNQTNDSGTFVYGWTTLFCSGINEANCIKSVYIHSLTGSTQFAIGHGLPLGTYYAAFKATTMWGWGDVHYIPFTVAEPAPQSIDIGLRVRNSSEVVKIAVEPAGTLTSPLRIAKNGTIYGVALVDVGDANGSRVKIQTSSGIKELRRYTGTGPIVN